jgi:hypothetical protein
MHFPFIVDFRSAGFYMYGFNHTIANRNVLRAKHVKLPYYIYYFVHSHHYYLIERR